MATVIFDYDSTLIKCESLEMILAKKNLADDVMQRIKDITNQGMSGTITFLTSLQKRMDVVPLNRQDFIDFGRESVNYLTPGMKELIQELKKYEVDVWIISGAVREVMFPVAKELEIPQEKILGIDLIWSSTGEYQGIDTDKPISHSKWEGAQSVVSEWSSPKIAVGDGITDYALFEHHLVDHFIAFTQNVRRQAILDKGIPEAHSVAELKKLLNRYIYE
jgi:HAD superfamily phosphoserine phosphatase-like hydrolase